MNPTVTPRIPLRIRRTRPVAISNTDRRPSASDTLCGQFTEYQHVLGRDEKEAVREMDTVK